MLPKQEVPKVPFFLFDIEKATGDSGEGVARDFLAETFFSAFKQKQEVSQENVLDKHGFQKKLKDLIGDEKSKATDVIEYLKTLSPSGIELEILSLASFEFKKNNKNGKKMQTPNEQLGKLLDCIL